MLLWAYKETIKQTIKRYPDLRVEEKLEKKKVTIKHYPDIKGSEEILYMRLGAYMETFKQTIKHYTDLRFLRRYYTCCSGLTRRPSSITRT